MESLGTDTKGVNNEKPRTESSPKTWSGGCPEKNIHLEEGGKRRLHVMWAYFVTRREKLIGGPGLGPFYQKRTLSARGKGYSPEGRSRQLTSWSESPVQEKARWMSPLYAKFGGGKSRTEGLPQS